MRLRLISKTFSVCRVADMSRVRWDDEYVFFAKADGVNTLVCSSEFIPDNTQAAEDGWRALRFEGVLDFSLIGILAKITAALAEAGISIFAISTYDTDYVLIKEKKLETALEALKSAGYEIIK